MAVVPEVDRAVRHLFAFSPVRILPRYNEGGPSIAHPTEATMANPPIQHITKTPGVCGGRACIAGHRIRVMDIVVWHELRGYTPDEIVAMFPGITLADVYAAMAYYFDHRDEIDQEFR